MDLNSRLFDKIRIQSNKRKVVVAPTTAHPCSTPGCAAPGIHKAPKGRDREGEFFFFCAEHVRDYNATYDYFKGMDDNALAKFRQEEVVGHRPTWKLGARAAGSRHVDETVYAEARTGGRRSRRGPVPEAAPRYNLLALKALASLDLDGKATIAMIKARYKELVKRHHPDANGGDRSSEDTLREIIQAYNFLKSNKLV